MAASTNASDTDGPATLPAAPAASVKMPAPTTTATPKTIRSQVPRSLRSRLSGSSVSAMDCSTDFVRMIPLCLSPTAMAEKLTHEQAAGGSACHGRPVEVGLEVDDAGLRHGCPDPDLGLVDGPGDVLDRAPWRQCDL